MGKRQDIMNATLDLIDEEGLQSVTFAKILKRAQVGAGTLYNYFISKEDLVNEIYRQARVHMSQSLLANYNPELDLQERFNCMNLNMLQFGIAFPKEFLFIDSYSYSPYIAAELRNMDDPSVEAVLTIIRAGQQQGMIAEMDHHFCLQLLHGIIVSIVKGYLIRKYPLNEQQVQQTLDVCWKAIKA